MAIRFFLHLVDYKIKRRQEIKAWINKISADHNKNAGEINIILTSDFNILKINEKYLNRKDYTDIITFDNSEKNNIAGELYISIERVIENAINYKVTSDHELMRVIIHGILHLLDYDDKKYSDKKKMKEKENYYLNDYYTKNRNIIL